MKAVYSPNLKKMPLSTLFAALSDPIRLEVILSLLDDGELTCGDCPRSVSKSTMSHHFRVLREAGLIRKREDGTAHYLSLRREDLELRLPGLLDLLKSAKPPL